MGTVKQNVESRKQAEALFSAMIECVRDDYRKLDQHGKQCFCTIAYEKFAGMLGHRNPTEKRQPTTRRELSPDVKQGIELCEEVLQLAADVPDEGWSFAESVSDSCREVMSTIEGSRKVTDRQMEALENWRDGLSRWIRD